MRYCIVDVRRFVFALTAYTVLAVLDLVTTWLALQRPWGVEVGYLRDLVYAGRYDVLFVLNVVGYAPFALMYAVDDNRFAARCVRWFGFVFLITTIVLRSYIVVNNLMVYAGLGGLPWIFP